MTKKLNLFPSRKFCSLFHGKYMLTDETIEYEGRTLHRIMALRDIPEKGVKRFDRGGWVETEGNLSQFGSAWVGQEGKVYDKAKIQGNATVRYKAKVHDSAIIRGSAVIYGFADVGGDSIIDGESEIYYHAQIGCSAYVGGKSRIHGKARLFGHCVVIDSIVRENASIIEKARIYDSDISGNSVVGGKTVMVCNESDPLA